MDAQQMKYEFDVGYDKITNFDAPGYEPKEISTFLTRSQEMVSYEILRSSANVEENKKAISKLRQVLPLTSFVAGKYPNGWITSIRVSLISVGTVLFDFNTASSITFSGAWTTDFIAAGFRIGDQITVEGSTNNDGKYSVITVSAGQLIISGNTVIANTGLQVAGTTVSVDSVLDVINERADITLGASNFYYDKIPVVPPTVPETYNNVLLDREVKPVDDDFYHANKENPYKKPSEKLIWRIDYADEISKQHEYITDGTFTLSTVHLHIFRKPRPIIVPETALVLYDAADGTIDGVWFEDYDGALGTANHGLDCLLDSIIHRDIVDKAVKLAYAALQDEKGFQISSVQEQQE